MAKILNVPYHSQWDDGAEQRLTGSGLACLVMLLDYYSRQVDMETLKERTNKAADQYLGFGQLQDLAKIEGLTLNYHAGHKLNDLKRWIDEDKPSIVLVRYSYWSQIETGVSTQSTFSGPQFVVVTGYGDGYIYVNDPNYWPPRRTEGLKQPWGEALFNLAWSNVRTLDLANPNNAALVPATAPMAHEDGVIEYIVQPGDSWASIAARFYGDRQLYTKILTFNEFTQGTPLYAYQRLRVPDKDT